DPSIIQNDSSSKKAGFHTALIDVMDRGIGIFGRDFETTICGVHEGAKSEKVWQAGFFHQGGSASLGWCRYVVIVSRKYLNPGCSPFVSFTVVRLDEGVNG